MRLATDINALAISPRSASLALAGPGDRYALAVPRKVVVRERQSGASVSYEAGSAVLFIDGLVPGTDYEVQAEDGGSCSFKTRTCGGLADIRDFGATEASANNQAPLQAAIDNLPGGGTLLVPAGTWFTAPLFLKSNMTLHLSEGATLAAATDRALIPILPATDPDVRPLGTWEGEPAASYASLVNIIGCAHVDITGRGTLDGGGAEGDWWQWPKETRNGARRARTLFVCRSRCVTVSGITVRNSPSWTVHPMLSSNVVFAGVSIVNPPDSPNTDGLNPESCTDVRIEGCRISVGDDCIAIKSGRRRPGAGGARHLAETHGIDIRHCLFEQGHGGIVIGSEMSGGVSDITAANCMFVQTDRGLRIKTRRGRGGFVRGISMTDCTFDGVGTVFALNAHYFCDADGTSDYVQDRRPATVDETTPTISNIRLQNIEASGVRTAFAALLGLAERQATAIRLENIRVGYDPNAGEDHPLMALDIASCRNAGILAENVQLEFAGSIEPPSLRQPQPVSAPCSTLT